MRLGRNSDIEVNNRVFKVTTSLQPGNIPAIETRVLQGEKTVYRKRTEVPEFRPTFKHSQKIADRVEAQHQATLELVQQGHIDMSRSTSVEAAGEPVDPSPVADLEKVISLLTGGDLESAERELSATLDGNPDLTEARELLEVVRRARDGAGEPGHMIDDFRNGAENFAGGRTRQAIEIWKGCLAAEPANRAYQLVLLLSSTVSSNRRKHWLEKVLALGSELIAGDQSAEAYSLLLVAQSAENQPTWQEAEGMTSTEDTLPPPVDHSSKSKSSEPETAQPSVDGQASDEDLFATQGKEEREGALFDEQEAEVEAAGPQSGTQGGRERRGARAAPPGSRSLPKVAIAVGAVALVLITAAVIAFLFTGGKQVPVEKLEEAVGYLNAGQNTLAVNAYSEILSTHGEIPSAYLGRGRARIASGDFEQGIMDLSKAVELETESPSIAEELADVLYTRGRFEDAVTYYRRARSIGDISAEASYRLASSLVAIERAHEAPEHLKNALQKRNSFGEARLLYGSLLNEAGHFAEAEEVLRGGGSAADSGGDYYYELGISLLEQGKLEEAEEIAGIFLSRDPSGARPRTLLGEVYLRRKQYEPARRELIQALRIHPQDPRAQIALGRTWLAIGKTRGDDRDLIKARQILTTAQGVHEGARLLTLGEVSLAEGDTAVAIDLIEESISRDANPLSARLALAEAKYAAQNLPGTAEELQRAFAFAPADPALALSLGLVYSELKDGHRASEQFLKAIQGAGMFAPADGSNGPVVLPHPYLPLPARFDVNRIIRTSYRQALSEVEDDAAAMELKALAESTSFVISGQN
jgi:tetratricopeptide (TPR) repeat protein